MERSTFMALKLQIRGLRRNIPTHRKEFPCDAAKRRGSATFLGMTEAGVARSRVFSALTPSPHARPAPRRKPEVSSHGTTRWRLASSSPAKVLVHRIQALT